jgi:hypothetical protein
MPAGLGIAIAFASIDMEPIPAGPIAGRAARPLSLLLILALVVPAILALVPTIRGALAGIGGQPLPDLPSRPFMSQNEAFQCS